MRTIRSAFLPGVLAAVCLLPAAAGATDSCPPSALDEECLSVQIGLTATPNPTPRGGTVAFAWGVNPATDCWDNLGHSAWGNYSFQLAVSDPFTWTVWCMGSGIQSSSLPIAVDGGGGGGGAVPAIISAPSISGTPEVGRTLTASPGSWTNGPTSYAYAWRRSGDLAQLGSGPTLALDGSHAGYQVRVDVQACNGTGCGGWSSSAWTATVAEPQPPSCAGTVVLYELPGYAGRCWSFEPGAYAALGEADRKASSVRVAAGYYASMFAAEGFAGEAFYTVLTSSPDAAGWESVGRGATRSLLVGRQPDAGSFLPEGGSPDGEAWLGHDSLELLRVSFEQAAAAGGGQKCWEVWDGYGAYSAGTHEFSHKVTAGFCVKGNKISRYDYGFDSHWLRPAPWPFNIVERYTFSGGRFFPGIAGGSRTVVRAEGRFEWCVKVIFDRIGACARSWESWVQLELSGNGDCVATNVRAQAPRPCARKSYAP